MRALFPCLLPIGESERMKAAAVEAVKIQHRMRITEVHVRKYLSRLRIGAQPGPSRTRNCILTKAMRAVGVDLLVDWSQMWVDAAIPLPVVRLLMVGLCRPIRKENGAPRPIMLLESVVKLATGVAQQAVRQSDSREGAAPWQFCGQRGGAEALVMTLRALMRADPTKAFCKLDLKNAFNSMGRAAMLEATNKWTPGMAKLLSMILCSSPPVAVEGAEGEWHVFDTAMGVAQGDSASSPAIDRAVRLIIVTALAKARAAGYQFQTVTYSDDITLIF